MSMTNTDSLYTSPFVQKARDFAAIVHAAVNHHYDGIHPYMVHLEIVANYAIKYAYLLDHHEQPITVAGAYVHDAIEDARQSYNDIKNALGPEVAEIAYALTNEKGRNRKGRANDKYYSEMRENPTAVFVKICDRLGNASYSANPPSRMHVLYAKEQVDFRKALDPDNREVYAPMWDELESILGLR